MKRYIGTIIVVIVLLLGMVMNVYTLSYAFRINGSFGFPLDDPWIHLQFAKNIHDYGSFSYYKNEMVTSGSTSPLYTVLLAVGFFIVKNEMILSYVLGIAFLTGAAVVFFFLLRKYFPDHIEYAIGGTALLLFEPRLKWASLSGMETTVFIALLITVLYFYQTRKTTLLGIAGGLLLWARPEAVLFLGAIIIDLFYREYIHRRNRKEKKRTQHYAFLNKFKKSAIILTGIALSYVGFNLLLSGSIFPNTYAAKIKYYTTNPQYLKDVFQFFTGGHFVIFSGLAAIGALVVLLTLVQRKSTEHMVSLCFSVGLITVYGYQLPFLYQEGRYLMPVLPFFIIIGLVGTYNVLYWLKKMIPSLTRSSIFLITTIVVMLVLCTQFVVANWKKRIDYAETCKYISDRQVKTALWIREHLPEHAVVATHDIGALAYYSNRKIVDMVGLVSPKMIDNIGRLDKLFNFLKEQKTTHVAVLRNWFEVVNVEPIFHTDYSQPEIMEVFEFDPLRIHFTPQIVSTMTEVSVNAIQLNDVQRAAQILDQAVRIDPNNSKVRYWLGIALLRINQLERAEQELKAAINLHKSYWDAQMALAEISLRRNKLDEAIITLENVIRSNPTYALGYRALAEIYQSFLHDTSKANEYLRKYNELADVN